MAQRDLRSTAALVYGGLWPRPESETACCRLVRSCSPRWHAGSTRELKSTLVGRRALLGRARWLGRPPVCSASLCARSVYVTECAHREAKLAELDTGSQGLPESVRAAEPRSRSLPVHHSGCQLGGAKPLLVSAHAQLLQK